MISPAAKTFYLLNAIGEAAEVITSVFSPGSMNDIETVAVLSHEFSNDIEPLNELDESLEMLKLVLLKVETTEEFNPLYMPMPIEALDEVLDGTSKSDSMLFTGMNGNPFAIKTVQVEQNSETIVSAIVSYKQFDLPGYDEILAKQTSARLH